MMHIPCHRVFYSAFFLGKIARQKLTSEKAKAPGECSPKCTARQLLAAYSVEAERAFVARQPTIVRLAANT